MKKIIIITILIVVVVAIAGGIFFFWGHKQNITNSTQPTGPLPPTHPVEQGSSTQNNASLASLPSGSLLLGDANVSSTDITSVMPADAPQGATIPFQVATGTIVLKNFYTTAQGYWPELDVLLIQYNPSYTIWYYRDSSDFEIDLPLGATISDEDAAAGVLAGNLGISQPTLCALPVTVVFTIDRGITNETAPLDFCPQPAQ